MLTTRRHILAIAIAIAFAFSFAQFAWSADTIRPARDYEVRELKLNGFGCKIQALDQGTAVGWCNTASGGTHAFVWTQQTGVVDIGTLGGSRAEANAVD